MIYSGGHEHAWTQLTEGKAGTLRACPRAPHLRSGHDALTDRTGTDSQEQALANACETTGWLECDSAPPRPAGLPLRARKLKRSTVQPPQRSHQESPPHMAIISKEVMALSFYTKLYMSRGLPNLKRFYWKQKHNNI